MMMVMMHLRATTTLNGFHDVIELILRRRDIVGGQVFAKLIEELRNRTGAAL